MRIRRGKLAAGVVLLVAALATLATVLLVALPAWLALGNEVAPRQLELSAMPATAQVVQQELELRRTAAVPELPALGTVPAQSGEPGVDARVVTFQVFDDAWSEIEGANVQLWEAAVVLPSKDGNTTPRLAGACTGQQLMSMTTDAEGLCVARLERSFCYVSAQHPDFGRSILRAVSVAQLGTDRRVQLWLLRGVEVHGVVIALDGQPVPGAQVQVAPDRGSMVVADKHVPTQPIAADDQGRFRFEAAAGARCTVRARDGELESLEVALTVVRATEIVVPFRGAFEARVQVVDEAGQPAARAWAWLRHVDAAGDDPEPLPAVGRTDDEGRVSIALKAYGRYLISAGRMGSNSAWATPVAIVCSAYERHPQVWLQLGSHAALRGTVQTSDGLPAAGLVLSVQPPNPRFLEGLATARFVPALAARDLPFLEGLPTSSTAADGTFALAVPPLLEWNLIAKGLDTTVVTAEQRELHLVLRSSQPPMTVTGELVGAPGESAIAFRLYWVDPSTRSPPMPIFAELASNRFRFSAQAVAPSWQLAVVPGDWRRAPALFGPLLPGPQHLRVEFPPAGSLPLRIAAGGRVARSLEVSSAQLVGAARRTLTDALGTALLDGLAPGWCRITVRRGFEVLAQREITLAPGPNPELRIDVNL